MNELVLDQKHDHVMSCGLVALCPQIQYYSPMTWNCFFSEMRDINIWIMFCCLLSHIQGFKQWITDLVNCPMSTFNKTR